MRITASDGGSYSLQAETKEDEAFIDALYLGNHIHIESFTRRPTQAGGDAICGVVLNTDRLSDQALRAQAGREALRAIGQLIGIGLREATGHRHVDGFAVNPKLQEKFAPSFEQIKLMAEALSLVVSQLDDQRRIGHGESSSESTIVAQRDELLALLVRYRNETPVGHQPHMIAHEVDAAIAKVKGGAA